MLVYIIFFEKFKQYKMLYEDVVLGAHGTSQYSLSVREGHLLVYLFFLKKREWVAIMGKTPYLQQEHRYIL